MKAAVLHQTGHPLVIQNNIEIPKLLPGQVLVKMAYSGICHSQLMEVRGKRGVDRYLPHMLGHEGSGEVVEIGDGVRKVKPKDKVILGWIKGDGMDVPGTQYRKDDFVIHAGAVTTFSEYSIVSENRCFKIQEDIPLDIAVLFGCAVPTGVGIITNTIKPKPENTIAIFGLGGIGFSVLMAVKLCECHRIIAVDVEEEKLNLAREFGASHSVNCRNEDPVEAIYRLTNGKGVDFSVESAGITTTIEQAFNSVRSGGGLCVFASHPKYGEKIRLDPHYLISGKNIKGTWGGSCFPDRDIPKFIRLYRQGKLPLEKLISKRYHLENIQEGLNDLENRKIIRGLVEIDSHI